MESGVVTEESLDRILLKFFLAAPLPEGYDHLSELCSVVTEMINPCYVKADCIVKLVDRIAYYSTPDMSYMERLGDIWRRILNDHLASGSDIRSSVAVAPADDFIHDLSGKICPAQEEIDISIDILHLLESIAVRDPAGDIRSDHLRSLAQSLCKPEARESIVSHFFVARDLDQVFDLVCCESERLIIYFISNNIFEIYHISYLPFLFILRILSENCSHRRS